MFLLFFLVVLLVLVSLSTSCVLGKVQGCSNDSNASVKICVGGYNESDWLPVCHKRHKDIIICQNGMCYKELHMDLMGSKGINRCCIPQVIVRKSSNSNCMNANGLCCDRDKVLCSPVHTDDHTVEYILGGTMALVIVIGVFLGWVCSYYYWAIRKPSIDSNLDTLIQTRLETNMYASVALPPMTQIEKKPPQPRKNALISPETSSISSETKKKPEESDGEKVVKGEKVVEGETAVKVSSEPPASPAPGNTIDTGEEEEHVHRSEHVTEVEIHEIPDEAPPSVPELIDFGKETEQEQKEVETVGEQNGDIKPLLTDAKDTIQSVRSEPPLVQVHDTKVVKKENENKSRAVTE